MKDLILAIDQGTTNSKALLINKKGKIIAKGSCKVDTSYLRSAWVQQDGMNIWNTVLSAIEACIKDVDTSRIAAIGISNQRESVVAWNSDSQPLSPVITWQCRRSTLICDQMINQGYAETILQKTGLPIDPLFPSSKITWMLQNITAVKQAMQEDNCYMGTIDSWLIWNFTNYQNHCCDASNGARTQLMNLNTVQWDAQLCKIYDIPTQILPKIQPSNSIFGYTKNVPNLPDGIPICGVMGDSHAALFGHGIRKEGGVKATYGTGSSLMTPLKQFVTSKKGITTTIAWQMDNEVTFALEGNITVCASSLAWAAQWLGLKNVKELVALAKQASADHHVTFIPALVGLGAPYWRDDVEGLIDGLTFNTGRAEIAMAVLESIIFQVYDVFCVMQEQAAKPLMSLYADGGPSQNHWLMQKQANLLSCKVYQCEAPEISALGAAYMAGLSVRIWQSETELKAIQPKRLIIKPNKNEINMEYKLKKWHKAINRVLS